MGNLDNAASGGVPTTAATPRTDALIARHTAEAAEAAEAVYAFHELSVSQIRELVAHTRQLECELAAAARNYEAAVTGRRQFREAYKNARAALMIANAAINPPDRSGISLEEWNKRLKAATADINVALAAASGTPQENVEAK